MTDVSYAIVLLTPDDLGAKKDNKNDLQYRARQNVIFEHGFLIGRLGRDKVCALVQGKVELPSDIHGVLYVHYDEHGAWKVTIAKEMRQSGLNIDMNKI